MLLNYESRDKEINLGTQCHHKVSYKRKGVRRVQSQRKRSDDRSRGDRDGEI